MHTLFRFGLLTALAFLFTADAALAQSSPVGKWRTIDDETGEPKSVVEIVNEGGELNGYIREVFREGAEDEVCTECPSGHGKGQPFIGLKILWGLEKDGDVWEGGEIMDPQKGKIYGAKVEPIDGGDRLEVRGFVKVPLMGSAVGRTQTWERVRS